MRYTACLFALLFSISATAASEPKWIIKGDNAFGCQTEQAVRQLHTMAILPSALDMALNQKLEAGECEPLPNGEVLERLSKSTTRGHTVYQIRRNAGDILFIDAKFAANSI